ncbi:MAG: hypothetical protein JNK99_17125 [Candidatus Accumulibacter sp.]|uniref:hypothetical protein n=1 Tax=Accumulibacter sp. TaxID=2053492 RepID=UPI001A3CE1C1|nr:hypothetical protein [Accumulibacter sp.]MBL8396439.1 hypothetical protein [Accumulibacter sp.]
MKAGRLLARCCLLLAVLSTAQADDVFVTRGTGSPVFSDRPQPGAKPVTLPPLNVIEPVPVARTAPPTVRGIDEEGSRSEPALPVYRRFHIVQPEDNGSLAANSALFEVRVAVEPPLQFGEGHAIMVSIDGRPVGLRFTSTEFMIPPEFWGDALPPANQRHQLDAVIVDGNGAVILRARPVRFQLRYVAGLQPWPWHRPTPLPAPPPKPRSPPPPVRSGVISQ